MKKIFWFIVIVFIAVAGFLAWHFLSPYSKVDILNAIPGKPVMVIETDNSYNTWKKLTDGEVWGHLKKHPIFAKVSQGVDMLDTLVRSNEKMAQYIGSRTILISMHVTGKGTYDFVYAIDLRRVSKLLTFKKYLSSLLAPRFVLKELEHNKVTIYQITDTKAKMVFNICFLQNILVASYSSKLLEASIDQFENPHLASDKNFLAIYDKIKGEGLFRLYLNFSQLDDYTNGILLSPDPNIRQISTSLFYAGLAFNIDNDNLIRCEGYTNFNDSIPSTFRAMINSGLGKTNLADVLPAKTASSVSLGFDRFTEYFDNFMNNLKEVPKSYNEYQASIKQAEDYLKIDLRKNLMSWIGNEAAMVHLPPMGLGKNNEFAVFLRARDMDDAKENLNYVMEQIRKRTPAKFDQVEYNGYSINYLSIKGFFKLLFGKYFQKLEKPYFTYIGDYVVFSNHPQTLKVIIDGFTKKTLLSNSDNYKSFTRNFSRKSNVLCIINTSQFLLSLQGTMNGETYAELQKNKEYILCFPYMGFQLEEDGHLFKTRFYVQYKAEGTEPEIVEPLGDMVNDSALMVTDQVAEQVTQMLSKVDDYIPSDLTKTVYTEKYDNGKPKVMFELKDGFRNGDYLEYYENGETKIKGQYKKDHKDGTWKFYDENGKLMQKVKFEDGKRK